MVVWRNNQCRDGREELRNTKMVTVLIMVVGKMVVSTVIAGHGGFGFPGFE